jgi:hypothetical protein
MRHHWKNAALALGLAGAFALSVPNTSFAAPAAPGAGVKAAAETLPGGTTEVRWRGRHAGGAIVAGLAAGIIGAAAANAWGPRYYYEPYPYYGYGPYYYGTPYAYYGPRYYYHRPYWRHRHWHHRHWAHRHYRRHR